METFALSQMRQEGLEMWHMPTILSMLSLFLQVSLVLFFISLLDFLWHLSDATIAVAIMNSVFCGLTLLFLAATTILPGFQFYFMQAISSTYHNVPTNLHKHGLSATWAFTYLAFFHT